MSPFLLFVDRNASQDCERSGVNTLRHVLRPPPPLCRNGNSPVNYGGCVFTRLPSNHSSITLSCPKVAGARGLSWSTIISATPSPESEYPRSSLLRGTRCLLASVDHPQLFRLATALHERLVKNDMSSLEPPTKLPGPNFCSNQTGFPIPPATCTPKTPETPNIRAFFHVACIRVLFYFSAHLVISTLTTATRAVLHQ